MKNHVQLITYVDRLGGGDLAALENLIDGPLHGLFGGLHLLPFYDPIDGADAGFDPVDHTMVDPRLGDWHSVQRLGSKIELMADVIVNHMSSQSPEFQDVIAKGAASPHADLFLTMDKVFPQGATERDLLTVYRPRPGVPFAPVSLKTGERRLFWATFTHQQIDIDVQSPAGERYLQGILARLASAGVRMVRLDAVGYAIKQAGTNCFMMPQTFAFIEAFAGQAKALGIEVLVEVHSYYQSQIDIAKRVDWVYDFALPPLLLHAFAFHTAEALKHWIAIRPHNAITVLDTHDGIGVIDIGADGADRQGRPGLISPEDLDVLVEIIHANSQGQSRQATGAAASNVDLYQVNCTYYDALAQHDRHYLLARAVQFFLPGIPQVYYMGLLAGTNDMALLQATGVGRDINRHHYAPGEVESALQKPVVQALCELIRLRNAHPAFQGEFSLQDSDADSVHMVWTLGEHRAALQVDFRQGSGRLAFSDAPSVAGLSLSHLQDCTGLLG